MGRKGSNNRRRIDYIIWQNRATRFYIATRLLVSKGIWAPAAFCSQQAIEVLLKATLIYWDRSFDPIKIGHKFSKMVKTMKNKVPNSSNVNIPTYFYFDAIFQQVSRYPKSGKGIHIPSNFLNDMDEVFFNLIALVPYQFNSELLNIIKRKRPEINILRRKNNKFCGIRKFLLTTQP